MDSTHLSLLDSIPQKPPRSKLETHRELIRYCDARAAHTVTSFAFFTNASASMWRSAKSSSAAFLD
jgi:hypothetical protein